MNKKILFIVLAAAALIVSLFIGITIDPATARYEKSLIQLHQSTDVIFIDSALKDFSAKVEDAVQSNEGNAELQTSLTAYKAQLDEGIQKIVAIYDTEIDNQEKDEAGNPKTNLIANAQTAASDVLTSKSQAVLKGIEKILEIAASFEKNIPTEVKDSYNPEPVEKLKALYEASPVQGVSGKKTLRLLLILTLGLIGGIVFILAERKARKSGEIKSSQVA